MKKIILILLILLWFCPYVCAQPTVYVVSGGTIVNGITEVTSANTAVPLSTDTTINEVHIMWHSSNTQPFVYVGSSTVTTNNGIQVTSGSVLTLKVDNLNEIYVTSASAGDRISWIAVRR